MLAPVLSCLYTCHTIIIVVVVVVVVFVVVVIVAYHHTPAFARMLVLVSMINV